MSFNARQAREMELHKDDFMFGVRERVYAEIQVAALIGNVGTVIEIPADCDDCVEFEIFIHDLIDNGFEVCEAGCDKDDKYAFEIYWGPFEVS